MPLPIINFGYTRDQLLLTFVNLTTDQTPDAVYNWNFGDGISSIEENPTHQYLTHGIFTVTLTVLEPGETPVSYGQNIHLDIIANNNVFFNIAKIVDLYLPPGLEPELVVLDRRDFQIIKWQNYLQPLVEQPTIVLPQNTYEASYWPPLVNALIAKLVVLDVLEMNATDFLLKNLNGEGIGTGSSSSTTTSDGGIKSIETGPTKIERYENKDSSSNSERNYNLSRSIQGMMREGGLFDQMRRGICQDADRVRLYLPMCGPLPGITTGMYVAREPGNGSSHNANPFGVTKRML